MTYVEFRPEREAWTAEDFALFQAAVEMLVSGGALFGETVLKLRAELDVEAGGHHWRCRPTIMWPDLADQIAEEMQA